MVELRANRTIAPHPTQNHTTPPRVKHVSQAPRASTQTQRARAPGVSSGSSRECAPQGSKNKNSFSSGARGARPSQATHHAAHRTTHPPPQPTPLPYSERTHRHTHTRSFRPQHEYRATRVGGINRGRETTLVINTNDTRAKRGSVDSSQACPRGRHRRTRVADGDSSAACG